MEESKSSQHQPRLTSLRRVVEDSPNGVCIVLEISFDTKCNAACLSCGSYCSSTWQKYNNKHNHTNDQENTEADRLLEQLITTVDLSQVRDITIMGGEPFYGSTGLKFLEHIQKIHPNLNQVTLRYQTNGSIFPSEEIRNLWGEFKQVTISLSIDGVGERFNYLRWPLKWFRVERTVQQFLDLTNVNFAINATISPLNALYFWEIEDWWATKIPLERRKTDIARSNRCFAPLDLNLSTPSLRRAILEKYGPTHQLTQIFSNLEFNWDYREYIKMFDYIEKHDKLRRLDWRKTFPDVVQHYNR